MQKTVKRVLSIFLVSLLFCSVCSVFAFAQATSGNCGPSAKWSLNTSTGVLTILGSGSMEEYSIIKAAPWDNEAVTRVVIQSGITSIGAYAFVYCENLASVSIANSVKQIGGLAFGGCKNLQSVSLPTNLELIELGAFASCSALRTVNIPSKVIEIGSAAFMNCTNLHSITIPKSVESIGLQVFEGCNELNISCYKDSTAHTYAQDNKIPYTLLTDLGGMNPVMDWLRKMVQDLLDWFRNLFGIA